MGKFTRITRHQGVALNIKQAAGYLQPLSWSVPQLREYILNVSPWHPSSSRGRNPTSQYLDTCVQPRLRFLFRRKRILSCPATAVILFFFYFLFRFLIPRNKIKRQLTNHNRNNFRVLMRLNRWNRYLIFDSRHCTFIAVFNINWVQVIHS